MAWDWLVDLGDRGTAPVSEEVIMAAKKGDWEILLTESKPVPRTWIPDVAGLDVLCLASGGGQQGPILAAAGAHVTVFDNSPRQLEQDRFVAERKGLTIITVEGDMADLSTLPNDSFDLIVHPVSNLFIPEVRPVWAEAFRVLRHSGSLLTGFKNPGEYVFDRSFADKGIFQVKYALPYSDLTSITVEERERYFGTEAPLEFSHTLEDQIGGQLEASFMLTGMYEDSRRDEPIARYMPSYFATRSVKP